MKTVLNVAVALLFTGVMVGCDVDVQDEGRLPDVDVQAEPGEMPDLDVRGPDVDMHMEEKTMKVPDVDVNMEEKNVQVPDIDVDVPEENENEIEAKDGDN